MKHDDVLTLRWSESKWPTTIKEQIKNWLPSGACKLKDFKKCRRRLLFPSKLVYNGQSVAQKTIYVSDISITPSA